MSNKAIYPEYFTKEEYEKEVDKSLKLGCVEHALLFYQFCRYCILHNEDFISAEKYYDLCDFLAESIHTLPKALQEYVVYDDLLAYDCQLELCKNPAEFVKGKHLIPNIKVLLDNMEDRIDIDYKLEVVEELDSVN